MNSFNESELRKAFGTYLTGVTVVTARSSRNELIGFTANSFTSVSMDPPLLLVCPGSHLSSFEEFEVIEHFAISVLAEDQESISSTFASGKSDRFDSVKWSADQFGSPIIDKALASFSCSTFQRVVAGDHLVLIGRIEHIDVLDAIDKKGLGYCSDGYFSLSNEKLLNVSNN